MALEQLLIEGRLDLALIALPPVKLKDEVPLLLQDEILLVVSHDHPVNALSRERVLDTGEIRRYVEMEDTMDYDYILSDYDTILGSMSRAAFSRRGLVPKVCNGNLTAPFAAAMARAGPGIRRSGPAKRRVRQLFLPLQRPRFFRRYSLGRPP